ncbi:NACHT domain-containing NTPase, partial [Hassallia byssoidea VB512170]
MPRLSYGDDVKARVRQLLEALLAYVNHEVENSDRYQIKCWKQLPNQVIIKTQSRTLAELSSLEIKQVRQALKLLEKFSEILEDLRAQKQGSENYDFRLTLWHPIDEKENNLQTFNEDWEHKRAQKPGVQRTEGRKVNTPKSKKIDDLVQNARDEIRPYIEELCGKMRVLGMNKPIEVDDIYTSVNILEKSTKSKWLSREELLQNAGYENFDRPNLRKVSEPRVPGLKAVEEHPKLMVLGKPGAGKTTFLKHIALQCINGNFEKNRVPLFVTLKSFTKNNNSADLFKYLTQQLIPQFIDSQVIEQLLKEGKLLILFDGLDEVQDPDKQVSEVLESFTRQYYKNKFVITCRIAAREYIFENFTDVEIADFNDEQIETFANKWFTAKNDASKAQGFISQLEINKPIKEIATNPLLLTLLCLVFEQKGIFPQNRADLYEEGLDILLDKWDTTRGVERDQLPYKNLSRKQRKDLLIQIAYPKFEDGKYFFKPEDVDKYIIKYYESLNIKDDIETKKILQSIEAQHGLLVERAHDIYSFSHLTYHEYFTARKIKEAGDDKILRDLCTHITETRWLEVFLLVAGLMRDGADQLLLFMEKGARSCINTDKLQELLRWADKETTGSMGDTKPYGKRALAIAHAYANAHAYDHNHLMSYRYFYTEPILLAYAYNSAEGGSGTHAYANANANAYAYPIANDYAYPIAIAIANANANANGIAIVEAIAKAISIALGLNLDKNGQPSSENVVGDRGSSKQGCPFL